MTKEEAIKIVKDLYNKSLFLKKDKEAVRTLIPEVEESEDEEIRKDVISFVEQAINAGYGIISKERKEKWIAWLEKKEEDTYDYKRVDLGKFDERIREFSDMLEDKPKPYWDGWYEAMDWIRVNGTPFGDKKQGEQPKKHDVCDNCDQQGSCVSPCPMKLVEKQGEQKPYGQRKECTDCQFNYAGECKGYCAMKRSEQKPAWSEEDESRMDNLCHFLEEYGSQYYGHLTLQGTISWLKFLKDRMRPQPKQEWSEEDKRNLFNVKCIIDGVWHNQYVREEIEHSGEELESLWHWLDNLWQRVEYPQNTWKPSKEQIIALRWILNNVHYNKHKEEISCLLEQIKDFV